MAEHSSPESVPAAKAVLTDRPEAARRSVTRLIAEHHAAVYRYAFRLAGSTPDAEDLTQQVFLVAQQRLYQLREPEKARGWLYAVLRSVYLKIRRKAVPVPACNLELDVDGLPEPAVPVEGFDRERLQAAINGLPDDYKLVVLMFYFEDRSYKEISQELEVPLGTVMSRLSRAKGRLREVLCAAEDRTADERAAPAAAQVARPPFPTPHASGNGSSRAATPPPAPHQI